MKAAIRRAFGKLRKLLCVRACDEEETVPVVVEDEMRARDRLALKQFFARRGVTWPARQKMEQQPPWTVKLRKLYPDLSEFTQIPESGNGWQVKMLNLYPDLSEFYC